ncbi:MAG: DUF86 domain-containing protein [Candidatus Thorarchaeota archaeon]|nr:DUF86 domain-containing protein [Candidatus Thorarchaeota archaeon]
MVSKERISRYLAKIDHATTRAAVIRRWLSEGPAADETMYYLALAKAAQELVEESLDLLSMMLRDVKSLPVDDYSNIENGVMLGLLTSKNASTLREAKGLRNHLVHLYNGVDIQRLRESLERLLPRLVDYTEDVGGWTAKHFRE